MDEHEFLRRINNPLFFDTTWIAEKAKTWVGGWHKASQTG
jgi:hypothetical protein